MPHLQKAMFKTFPATYFSQSLLNGVTSLLVSNFNSKKEISPKSWQNKQAKTI